MPTLSVTGGVTVMPVRLTVAAGAVLSLTVGLAVLLSRQRAIGQTTLSGAWWWSAAAFVAWSGTELAAALSTGGSDAGLAPLRLAAISLSFCPVIALIGAKRPQHRAWNLVVASLWAIVALPAAETFFLRPGQAVAIGDARGWFLWILILLGPVNFVPTRYWAASSIFAAGQVVTFSPYLAGIHRPLLREPAFIGLLLAAIAMGTAWLMSLRPTRTANPYDRLWLDFRDTFGLFWALRVQERINAAATQYGWDLELTWRGFRRPSKAQPMDSIDPLIEPALRTTLRGLLRRFVSGTWIAARQEK